MDVNIHHICYRQRLHIHYSSSLFIHQGKEVTTGKKRRNDTDTDDDENDSKLSFYAADPSSLFDIPM